MSEKYTNRGSTVYENDEELSTIDVVDLLNEQQATINQLKEENERMRQFITKGKRLSVKELMANTNENELLKKKIRGLEKENEELKFEIRKVQRAYEQLWEHTYK